MNKKNKEKSLIFKKSDREKVLHAYAFQQFLRICQNKKKHISLRSYPLIDLATAAEKSKK